MRQIHAIHYLVISDYFMCHCHGSNPDHVGERQSCDHIASLTIFSLTKMHVFQVEKVLVSCNEQVNIWYGAQEHCKGSSPFLL